MDKPTPSDTRQHQDVLFASQSSSDEEHTHHPKHTNTPSTTPTNLSALSLPVQPKVEVCCICMDELVPRSLPVTLPCTHTAHYNCVMGVENKLCPLCRAAIPESLRKHVEVEEDILGTEEPPLWQYRCRDNRQWWFYQPDHSTVIELAYQNMLVVKRSGARITPVESTVNLTIRGKIYTIDMVAMKQRSPTGVERQIKRREPTQEPEGIKGIAGAVPKH